MIIEIEKKYELTSNDYKIIKEKCDYINNKVITDKYHDTEDYKLFNLGIKYRIRNGKNELKLKLNDPVKKISRSIEYSDIETINEKLSELGLKFEDLNEVLQVITNREKYEYNFEGTKFIIDIDKYKYGERYEIELNFDDDKGIDASKLIDDFRNYLGLTGKQKIGTGKVGTFAQHENPEFYKLMLKLQ